MRRSPRQYRAIYKLESGIAKVYKYCYPVGSVMLHSAQRSCQTINCSTPALLFSADPPLGVPPALLRDLSR
jgi:hypothetical protein